MAEVVSPDKVKKPKDSRFKQQKLPAWQPILTAGTVLPLMFAIGIAFIPLGIAFLITSNEVQEKVIDYTNCLSNQFAEPCSKVILNLTGSCNCQVNFTLQSTFKAPVYVYYGLTNYYQNHRRYVKSRDDNQLLGSSASVSTDCKPYDKINDTMAYAPCGVIANSLFNDSISIFSWGKNKTVMLKKKNIAWSTDVQDKYKNPSDFFNSTSIGNVFASSVHPPNWRKNIWELDLEDNLNNGYLNEDLIVWMRTAALPNFRKLYRLVNHDTADFKDNLPAGNYSLNIIYNYNVVKFSGTKRIVLTTTSFLGGKNPFLGIAYIVVGCISVVIGFVFLFIHLRLGKRS